MEYTDARATNLFARLFSYAPRPTVNVDPEKHSRHRNALEDYCTEALAWCLISSKLFSDRLFALECFVKIGFQPASFEVDTQLSFSNKMTDDKEGTNFPKAGRFDLVLKSTQPTAFLLVIECKIAPDSRDNIKEQIIRYKEHIGSVTFKDFTEKRIILLSPYTDKHNADAHLSWDQVYDILCKVIRTSNDRVKPIFEQFAEFIKMRHLSKMKLPSTSSLLPALKKAAPLLAGLDAIFASIRNDDIGRSIFTPGNLVPKLDANADKDENYLWYGIWSRGARPTYYVGFHTTCLGADPLCMSIKVTLDGDRRTEAVPKNLKQWFNKDYSGLDGKGTAFFFTAKIDATYDGNTAAIENWIIARLREVKSWAESL